MHGFLSRWDPWHVLYWVGLAAFGCLVGFAGLNGWWSYALVGLVFASIFAFAGRFVLYRRWRPRPPLPPPPTRRPVVRRRR